MDEFGYEVYLVDHSRIQSLYGELHDDSDANELIEGCLKRKCKSPVNLHFPIYFIKIVKKTGMKYIGKSPCFETLMKNKT